jgi:hypothetical protein
MTVHIDAFHRVLFPFDKNSDETRHVERAARTFRIVQLMIVRVVVSFRRILILMIVIY